MDLKGKRLLVLGSTPLISEIVVKAQSLGAVVGVTDYVPYEESMGKKLADESYDISLADVDAVAKLIEEKHFDGVLTGFTDSYLTFYQEICEAAGVPCYGGTRQFEIATDKRKFKDACTQSKLSVIPGGIAKSLDDARTLALQLNCPLILKPTDNSGSRGVVRCSEISELEKSYEYALSFSPSKTVIVERFMDCDSIGISYYVVDGEVRLTSTCDRGVYASEGLGSPIASSLKYPSKYHERYLSEANAKAVGMVRACGFDNGMLSLQAFVDDDFYFCEMCYRPSGGHHYIVIQDQTGEDELGMLIEYAVNGVTRFCTDNDISGRFDERYSVGKIIGKPNETIASIRGVESLSDRDGVLFVSQTLNEGDVIGRDGTTAQVIASVWYKASMEGDIQKSFEEMCSGVSVEDCEGKSLVKVLVG